MKTYVTRVVPESTRKYVEKATCDFCGADTTDTGNYKSGEYYAELKLGYRGYEYDDGDHYDIDICYDCAKTIQGNLKDLSILILHIKNRTK